MNHREYLKLITEAPIAYDDETYSKIGKMDTKTKTKWGLAPNEYATMAEVKLWVKNSIKSNYLKPEILGSGVSKIVKINDDDTVFKFNYENKENGNQIIDENNIYKKFGKSFSDVIPKTYKSGNNWQIIEKIVPFNSSKAAAFKKDIGISISEWWPIGAGAINYLNAINVKKTEADIKYSLKNVESIVKKDKTLNAKKLNAKVIKIFTRMSESQKACRIFLFCLKSGADANDFHSENIGFRGDKVVVLDYGYKNS